MARYLVSMVVEIDEDDVALSEDGSVSCGTTGDSYESMDEFFEHQLDRDLQCMVLVEGELKVKLLPEE